MNIIINPGTGPLEGATREQADMNMRAFLDDLSVGHTSFQGTEDEHGGRFRYIVQRGARTVEVDMPGIALKEVRGYEGQSIFAQPRLYVDGSSWLWGFALGMAADRLTGGAAA